MTVQEGEGSLKSWEPPPQPLPSIGFRPSRRSCLAPTDNALKETPAPRHEDKTRAVSAKVGFPNPSPRGQQGLRPRRAPPQTHGAASRACRVPRAPPSARVTRKLSLAGKGTGQGQAQPARGRAGARTRGQGPAGDRNREQPRGALLSTRACPGTHPAPRPGGGTPAAALPGAAAAGGSARARLRPAPAPAALGQGWSGQALPTRPRPAPRTHFLVSPPPARCSWLQLAPSPSFPSPSPLLSLSVVSFPHGARTHSRPLTPWLSCLSHTLPHCLLLFFWTCFPSLSASDTFPFVVILVTLPLFPSLSPSLPPPPLPGLGPSLQLCLPWLRGGDSWPTAGGPA